MTQVMLDLPDALREQLAESGLDQAQLVKQADELTHRPRFGSG